MVLPSTEKPDSFQLSNPNNGTIYKFLCDSEEVTDVWISNLKDGVKENSKVIFKLVKHFSSLISVFTA